MSEDRLTFLLTDAVAGVEPADRLAEIRARIGGAATRRRTWWFAGGGAALAVAATVAVVAVTSTPTPDARPGPTPYGGPTSGPTTSPTGTATSTTAPTSAVAVYYLGRTPAGLRLFREFHRAPADLASATAQLASDPDDPDYRTLWHPGDLGSPEVVGDVIKVPVVASRHDRPAGMTQEEADLSVEQVIYTVQAAAHQRLPVQFTLDGNPIDQVLGVPTSEPLANGQVLDTLSLVNLTTPAEGATVSGSLDVEGVANSFEANVPWLVEDASGTDVSHGNFTATGWMDTKLFPFQGSIDVSSLDPGTYSLIVYTDDPSGGAEGNGAFSDSRSFRIE